VTESQSKTRHFMKVHFMKGEYIGILMVDKRSLCEINFRSGL